MRPRLDRILLRKLGATLLAAAGLLTACGGGGGDPTQPARVAVNLPPVAAAKLMGEAVLSAPTVFDTTGTTAANFLRYVNDGFCNGLLFQSVIANFIAQSGGYKPGPLAKAATYAPIVLESNNGLKNWRYTLAMARTGAPDSATSQFYINLKDNPDLDYNASVAGANGYAVFGQVISGTALVDALGSVTTQSLPSVGLSDVPVQDVVIMSAVRMP